MNEEKNNRRNPRDYSKDRRIRPVRVKEKKEK